jgi:2-oxo-4-hydroxy-4-carboxy-5-ureidoimidazoline decarboxylase
VSKVLERWNSLSAEEAAEEILPCCGSGTWAREMTSRRPILDEVALFAACDAVCKILTKSDWHQAFSSHPRIGQTVRADGEAARNAAWSREEQSKVSAAVDDVRLALSEGNRAYEERFGRIFIVCATGKSGPEILKLLQQRLGNDEAAEFLESTEQQRQIAHLRLRKWLAS